MNTYRTEFFARCPSNGIRIRYSLQIRTTAVVMVEDLLSFVEAVGAAYHEELADRLLQRFGGLQTMVADHHGVTIHTTRGGDA